MVRYVEWRGAVWRIVTNESLWVAGSENEEIGMVSRAERRRAMGSISCNSSEQSEGELRGVIVAMQH